MNTFIGFLAGVATYAFLLLLLSALWRIAKAIERLDKPPLAIINRPATLKKEDWQTISDKDLEEAMKEMQSELKLIPSEIRKKSEPYVDEELRKYREWEKEHGNPLSEPPTS